MPNHTVQVVGGVPFEVSLLEDVPADCKPGQPLRFQAAEDVRSGDTVVVAKGAIVTGVIVDGAKKKFLVKTARPTFRLLQVTAVDGSILKVRATSGRLGESRKEIGVRSAGAVLGPKTIPIRAGSRFLAYFDGDQVVTVRP